MEITQEQKAFLDSFICERLTANAANNELIKRFKSVRGAGLVSHLNKNGWKEDEGGKVAFYLIKNDSGFPCLYFSLQCGALFEPLDQEEFLNNLQTELQKIDKKISTDPLLNSGDNEGDLIFQYAAELVRNIGVSMEQAVSLLRNLLSNKRNKLQNSKNNIKDTLLTFQAEQEKEGDRPILRVHKTMPGVELVQFCSNDEAKAYWKSRKDELGIDHFMGEVLFWHFIVPKIIDLQALVGCQYLFLFAADNTRDSSLLTYYEGLKFVAAKGIGTSKPLYDFGCVFMSQDADELKKNRDDFYKNFNFETNDDVI